MRWNSTRRFGNLYSLKVGAAERRSVFWVEPGHGGAHVPFLGTAWLHADESAAEAEARSFFFR